MAQRKKDDVRTAILEAAFRLFAEHGYADTSLPAIAREAGISSANVYVYFRSKLDVLYTLYEPWLAERLDRLERALAKIGDPAKRLERLLMALWRDLPRETNGFANNVMQALSTSSRNDVYSPRLRKLFQSRVAGWIEGCVPLDAREAKTIAGVMLMAFDGFAMNVRLAHGVACNAATAQLLARMLMSSSSEASLEAAGSRSASLTAFR